MAGMDSAEDGSAPSAEESSHDINPSLSGQSTRWRPSGHVFRMYGDVEQSSRYRHRPRLIVDRPIAVKLSKDIIVTYQTCNPAFKYLEAFNPKRYLTNPSIAVSNGGLDNENSDLILAVNDVLINKEASHSYVIKELLGQGTFGQVVKCWADSKDCFVAVKVIKNQPAYHQQAISELQILNVLNGKYDPEDKHHIVRIYEFFIHQEHLCIVFEMLGVNLYELLKSNHFKGISLKLIRIFTKQILTALAILHDASVIHCDLKPENILLTTRPESAELKLIDFGSACMEHRTVYSYIQSRFYRSPEVVLGHKYTIAIDMWSFGCVAAELFLGLPLFPAESQYDLLQRVTKILGGKPPDHILRNAKNTSKYFKHTGAPTRYNDSTGDGLRSAYQFLTPEELTARDKTPPTIGRHYFDADRDLKQIIINYPMKKGMTEEEIERETSRRFAFIDFIRGVVNLDPLRRWTPRQAAQHPFVTEEPFTGFFQPPPEPPRMFVYQAMTVDHNPVLGHWFGAGLSPQMSTNTPIQPHYTGGPPYSYGSSYGSPGSYGSFGDGGGAGHGGSYGSYGDAHGSYVNHRTHSGVGHTAVGISPDTRRRVSHMPHNAALGSHASLGFSPSNAPIIPMTLGASPSNFTPQSSHSQLSPGSPSTGSPSRYGPTSPARSSGVGGGGGATNMGKAAAFGHYNKRRGFNSPGSSGTINGNRLDNNSTIPWPNIHQSGNNNSNNNNESCSTSYIESTLQGSPLGSPRNSSHHSSQFRQKNGMVGGSCTALQGQGSKLVFPTGTLGALMQPSPNEAEDTSPPPNPGDWDPNYSEELLFDNDGGASTSGSVLVGTSSGETQGSTTQLMGQDFGGRIIPTAQSGPQFGASGMMPVYMDSNLHAMHGYTARPLHHSHLSQQISASRLGHHQPIHYLPLQQQHQWAYVYPPIAPRDPVTEHPQVFQPGLHYTVNSSYDYMGQGNGYLAVPEPPPGAQGLHSLEHMNALPDNGPHWVGGFHAPRHLISNEHFSGRRNGTTNGVFPPTASRR